MAENKILNKHQNKAFFRKIIFKGLLNLSSFVIFISILLSAAVCSAFINIYADIDKKVSSELNNYGANLIISPKNFENPFINQHDLQAKLSQISALKHKSEYLFGTANIGVSKAVIMGADFKNLRKLMPYLDLKEGTFIDADFDENNALIGVDLAKLIGAKLGDIIEISPDSSNIHKVRIKGIVYDGEKEDNLLIISLGLAQEIFNKENQINYATAIINGDFGALSALSAKFSDENISFWPVSKVSKTQGQILEKINLLMALISLSIFLISSICINTSLSQVMLARVKEFALVRVLGASKKDLFSLISTQILIVCFLGAVCGAILGYFLAILLGYLIFSSSVDFRVISLIISVCLSMIFAGFASFYPIKRALKPDLAQLLRE